MALPGAGGATAALQTTLNNLVSTKANQISDAAALAAVAAAALAEVAALAAVAALALVAALAAVAVGAAPVVVLLAAALCAAAVDALSSVAPSAPRLRRPQVQRASSRVATRADLCDRRRWCPKSSPFSQRSLLACLLGRAGRRPSRPAGWIRPHWRQRERGYPPQ